MCLEGLILGRHIWVNVSGFCRLCVRFCLVLAAAYTFCDLRILQALAMPGLTAKRLAMRGRHEFGPLCEQGACKGSAGVI
jgi:hypothetical protein